MESIQLGNYLGQFGMRDVFLNDSGDGNDKTSLSSNLSELLLAMLPNVFGRFGHRCDPGDGECTWQGLLHSHRFRLASLVQKDRHDTSGALRPVNCAQYCACA